MMTSSSDRCKTYLFQYQHDGVTWGFDIKAKSLEDAKARLSKMANAKYDGVLMLSIPIPVGILAGFWRLLKRFNSSTM